MRAVYTMPTLHNPLGWVLNTGQRQALADLARQHDLLIIEDAAYARLVSRPPPVVSYAPERTVYVTGFSKISPPDCAWGGDFSAAIARRLSAPSGPRRGIRRR